jgi:Patatin-like phospholipase
MTGVTTHGFSDVLAAELREVLPDPVLPGPEVDDESALAQIAAMLDRPATKDLAALCLSGGGIRSAAFGLGALQGLARFGLLGEFHYLSTVSGGGYIGSWLTAWRSIEDDQNVFAKLVSMQATGREPPQITGVRSDSNYITPMLGLLSADTWTVLAIYVRNLLLNWLLFVPLVTGGLLFPFWYKSALAWAPREGGLHVTHWLLAGCVLLTIGLGCAVCGRFKMQNEWLSRSRFLGLVLAPIVLSAMCFTVGAARGGIPAALDAQFTAGEEIACGAIVGAVIYAAAWLFGRVAAWRWDLKILVLDLICWILAGAVVGLLIARGLHFADGRTADPSLTAILGLSGVVLAYLVGDVLYVGTSSFSRRGDIDREWLARASGWLAAVAMSWALLSTVSLYGPAVLSDIWGWRLSVGVGSLSGIVTLFLGPSALTAATTAGRALERIPLTRIASAAALIFAVVLGALLSLLGQDLLHRLHGFYPGVAVWKALLVMAALVLASFVISLFVNVNRFSLHAMYRHRLVRGFLGSARGTLRTPDPFTGFDPKDNPSMATTQPKSGAHRLFHVINTTLNVVSTTKAAWQERKAESFTVTRQYCGNRYVGYQPTNLYGGRRGGITLGTAMAISGAAVSPNQGYNSSPLIGFLLMLFNVRLGWWLGNPARKYFDREGPLFGITPALEELAGATSDRGRWVYLSDGGHFDNLGLYEMVRRRCRFIVVIDSGCDPKCKFEDLGNAVRKAYIDFGVSINFGTLGIVPRQDPPVSGARFATATISYPGSTRSGWLLYIKPTYYRTTEGVDVRGYASDHPDFPHESTTDQWFSESQLEAYRALGAHIVEHICSRGADVAPGASAPALSLEELKARALAVLAPSC